MKAVRNEQQMSNNCTRSKSLCTIGTLLLGKQLPELFGNRTQVPFWSTIYLQLTPKPDPLSVHDFDRIDIDPHQSRKLTGQIVFLAWKDAPPDKRLINEVSL